jgi:alpha-1,2-mannosyltransferase
VRHSRLLNGAAPVLVLVLAAALVGALRGGFTDLFVYRYGGRAVLEGLPLFDARDPVTGLRFTYPPFAAVVMVPLAVLPARLGAALWTGASVGALALAGVPSPWSRCGRTWPLVRSTCS